MLACKLAPSDRREMPALRVTLERLGRPEHRLGVAIDLDVLPNLSDAPIAVDQKGRPTHPPELATVPRLLAPSPIGGQHFLRLVGGERDAELVLVAEFVLRLDRVGRNAEHIRVDLVESALQPAERNRFPGAARRVGLGVEKENQLAALEISQRYGAPTVTRQGESRRLCTDRGDHMPSFRRFRRLNVTGDRTPVKGWRDRGIRCKAGSDSPAADAPDFEGRGLEGKGKSGRA